MSKKSKLITIAVISVLILITAVDSFYVVDPTEMAGVRRLGSIVSEQPIGAGLHTKIPFIDIVDPIQVSLDTLKVDNLQVYTVDNQPVGLSISMSYRIPPEAVFKLLYQVGRSGNFDVISNVKPVIADRASRVFAKANTTQISANREQIATDIKREVTSSVSSLFGLQVVDLQISNIVYSKIFEASVEAAVKAKNDAIAAENTVRRIEYEGQQKVVAARAQAEATIAAAEAEKRSAVLRAEGEATRIRLEGAAVAESLKMRGDAIRDNLVLIELTKAEQWNGQLPSTMLSGTVPFLNINK